MAIEVNDVSFCIPVISRNFAEAQKELTHAAELGPDVIEFRRDYFEDPENEDALFELLKSIRDQGIEILFTFRKKDEGGYRAADDFERSFSVINALELDACDYIDIERENEADYLNDLKERARERGVKVIISSHNFFKTPENSEIEQILSESAEKGDIAKAAFYCNDFSDFQRLMEAGSNFRKKYPEIPLILIGMDQPGVLSRIAPEILNSNLTFVTDEKASAPGQISLEDAYKWRIRLGIL